MRIAFFGLPLAACLLAHDGHEIVYAAICRRAPGLRRLSTRAAPGRTKLRPDMADPQAVAALRAQLTGAAPDLVVSWFWTSKLPPAILEVAPAIGVHPSLLPRHRGPDPYFWAIDSGDAMTGVTAHELDTDYDTGAILGQREIAIDAKWNAWQLARALDRPSLALLRDVVRAYAERRPPRARAQDSRAATLAPEPTDADLAIVWSWPAARIERRVRAAAPWPGAFTSIGDRTVTLSHVRATPDFPRALEPGEAAVRSDGVAVVRASDLAVELLEGHCDESDEPLSTLDLAQRVVAIRG